MKAAIQFTLGVKSVLKMYLLVHLLPLLLFKLPKLKKKYLSIYLVLADNCRNLSSDLSNRYYLQA
jgi:hypothetical protein